MVKKITPTLDKFEPIVYALNSSNQLLVGEVRVAINVYYRNKGYRLVFMLQDLSAFQVIPIIDRKSRDRDYDPFEDPDLDFDQKAPAYMDPQTRREVNEVIALVYQAINTPHRPVEELRLTEAEWEARKTNGPR